MTTMNTTKAMTGAAVLWLCGAACGDPPAEPTPPTPPVPPASPASEAPKQPERKPGDEPPSLDELLGISPKTSAQLGGVMPDTTKTDLDKRLSAEQVGDLFQSAVELMGEASKRLSAAMEAAKAKAAGDASRSPEAWLQTQRVQEDVVRKLDAMIAELEKQGGGSQSRSRQPQSSDPNQPQQQRASQKKSDRPGGDGQAEHDGPEGRPGELRPELDAAKAAWGALPERVRDMLQQGSGDKYSSLYERLTADYYKRLAEQGRTRGGAGSGDRKP